MALNTNIPLQVQPLNVLGKAMQASQLRNQFDARDRRNTLAQNLPQAMTGDQDAIGAVAGASPEMGMQIMQHVAKMDETQRKRAEELTKRVGGIASDFMRLPPDQQQQMFPQYASALAEAGMTDVPSLVRGYDAFRQYAAQQAAEAGILSEALKANQPKYSGLQKGVIDGQQTFFRIDERTGQPQPIQGVSPQPSAPAAEVNIKPTERETKFEETVGAGFGEQYLSLQEDATRAYSVINRLNRFKQLMEGVETGSLRPAFTTIKSLAKGLGINPEEYGITDDTGPAEALRALGVTFATDRIQDTKGAVSDREMSMFAQAAPGLSRTPEGNRLMIDFAKRAEELKVKAAKMARDYYRENGTFDEGFYDRLQEFHEENPLFTESIEKRMAELNAPASSGKFKGEDDYPSDSYPVPQSQEEYNALKSGDLYRDPDDGKLYRKP